MKKFTAFKIIFTSLFILTRANLFGQLSYPGLLINNGLITLESYWEATSQSVSYDTISYDTIPINPTILVDAEFIGGEKALMNYLFQSFSYPIREGERDLNDKVELIFQINEDGTVSDVKLIRAGNRALEPLAKRIIESMPKWKPGTIDGKPYSMGYKIVIDFFRIDRATRKK